MAQNNSQATASTAMSVEKEIEEEILNMWLDDAENNVVIWRIIDGVSTMLGVNRNEVIKYMPKFLSSPLLRDTRVRRDLELATTDAVLRIAETLMDYEMWDAYHESHAPSAYRYAAAVAAWLYLFATSYGGAIPLSCPLYDTRVRATVAEFLATLIAYPIYESLHKALVDATEKWIHMLSPERREAILKMPRERRAEEALLRFCYE